MRKLIKPLFVILFLLAPLIVQAGILNDLWRILWGLEPVLSGTLVYQPQGGTGTNTKDWTGIIKIDSGVWGTTSGAGGGAGAWSTSTDLIYADSMVLIGGVATTVAGTYLEIHGQTYSTDNITSGQDVKATNMLFGSYLVGNAIGAIDMRSDPWSLYGAVDLEINDGNLTFATTGDAYIYFNANAEYLGWQDATSTFIFSDDLAINNNLTVSGSTTYSGMTSCGKLFTDGAGIFACGVDATGGTGGVDTWNITGSIMDATNTVLDVRVLTASTTLATTTISGPLTYASTSLWDAGYTYRLAGTSTAGLIINGSRQIGLDGLVCRYDNASTTLWDTAYSWGNHASAGYMTNFATSVFLTNQTGLTTFATSVFALDTDLNNYMTIFNTSVFALDTDLSIYMTNFATSMFMTTFATSVFALDTDLSAYMTTFATSVFALDTDLSAYMTTFATSVFLTGSTGLTTFATSVFALDTDLNNYMTTFATSVFLTNQTGLTTFATSVFVLDTDYSNYLAGTTSKRTASINFLNTTTTEPYRRATFRVPGQVTITQIGCYTGGGESQMAFYESVYTNPNVTTSILTADITCDYDSQTNGALLDSIVGATGLITTYVAGVNAASTTYVWINYNF